MTSPRTLSQAQAPHGQAQSFRRGSAPYDRTRALIDGAVQIDGVNPRLHDAVAGRNLFPRFPPHAEFDICELSLSSFTVKTAQGNCPYVGVPAFVSRAFRHTSIYVRTDRIKKPSDLKGKRVGVPEYQLTANVWARAILEDDHGVKPSPTFSGCAAASRTPTGRKRFPSSCRPM